MFPLDLNLFWMRFVISRKAETGWLSGLTIGLEIFDLKAPNEGVMGVLLKIENWRNRAMLVATDLLMARERENIGMAVTMLSRLSYCEG